MSSNENSLQQTLDAAMIEAVRMQRKIISARKKLAALRRDAETCSVSAGELPVRIMEIEEVLK